VAAFVIRCTPIYTGLTDSFHAVRVAGASYII